MTSSLSFSVTIPPHLVRKFNRIENELGCTRQQAILTCITEYADRVTKPSIVAGPSTDLEEDRDLYMLSAPERLKVYTFSDKSFCLMAEEMGDYHPIDHGDKYSWLTFSRDSKKNAEGWEKGKNGKLCLDCYPIASAMWNEGKKYF